jgi:hypothetical protein
LDSWQNYFGIQQGEYRRLFKRELKFEFELLMKNKRAGMNKTNAFRMDLT